MDPLGREDSALRAPEADFRGLKYAPLFLSESVAVPSQYRPKQPVDHISMRSLQPQFLESLLL